MPSDGLSLELLEAPVDCFLGLFESVRGQHVHVCKQFHQLLLHDEVILLLRNEQSELFAQLFDILVPNFIVIERTYLILLNREDYNVFYRFFFHTFFADFELVYFFIFVIFCDRLFDRLSEWIGVVALLLDFGEVVKDQREHLIDTQVPLLLHVVL